VALPSTRSYGRDQVSVAIEPPPFHEDDAGGPLDVRSALEAPARAVVSSHASAPRWLTASEARYLRIHDVFPDLPSSLRQGRAAYLVQARICVDPDGEVATVRIEHGAEPTLDGAIVAAVRTWRYRPLVLAGIARPFCHLMLFNYARR
jgi:hypothetical protein